MSDRVTIEAPRASSDSRRGQPLSSNDLWERSRRLIEHEDGLVNIRLGWMFAFNGFLFAALGLTLSAEAISLGKDVEASDFFEMLSILRSAVGVVGVLVGVASWVGVIGAIESIIHVKAFCARKTRYRVSVDPYVTGPGAAASASGYAAIAVPVMMIMIWASWLVWLSGGEVRTAFGTAVFIALVFLLLTAWALRNAERHAREWNRDV